MLKILIAVLLISKCGSSEITKADLNRDFCVYYSKGSAWTGFHYEAQINSNGNLIIKEIQNLPSFSERRIEFNIDKIEVDSLLYALQSASSIKLGNYEPKSIKANDFPTVTIRYTLNNFSDSTSICRPDKNELPNELELLLGLVNRIILKYDTKK